MISFTSICHYACLREEQHKTLSEGEAVVFKLTGYASNKEKNEAFYSSPFYTSPGGYKMCIQIYTNGEHLGKDTHASVYTNLLEGRYDDQLPWPFQGTVTYKLLNQLADDRHHIIVNIFRANTDMCVGRILGCPQFFPHSSLLQPCHKHSVSPTHCTSECQ